MSKDIVKNTLATADGEEFYKIATDCNLPGLTEDERLDAALLKMALEVPDDEMDKFLETPDDVLQQQAEGLLQHQNELWAAIEDPNHPKAAEFTDEEKVHAAVLRLLLATSEDGLGELFEMSDEKLMERVQEHENAI